MEHWNNKNLSAVQEYPFDFKQYIENRLREIDDMDERRFAKTVLLEGLGKVIECLEDKYQALERRIYEEIEIKTNRYGIVTTIIRKEDYDPMNGTLFPLCQEDLDGNVLSETLSSDKEYYIGTVFVKANEEIIERFKEAKYFYGREREGSAQEVYHVRPAKRYRDRIEFLYHTFLDNHIPWETVHTGFLDRFYDVFLETDEEKVKPEGPEKIQVNYGEFAAFVQQDIIPLWNIEQNGFDSADFMLPCIDGIYYEHTFLTADKGTEDGYLIVPNQEILEVRHETGKIVMKSKEETFESWQVLRVVQKETEKSLNYTAPLLTNQKKDSYFRRLSEKTHQQLMTKTDLFRRITELDIAQYIEVENYQICEYAKEYPAIESMNWFVKDELFPMESRKILLLQFREKIPGFYLNDSMVRFAVSQIQLEISEYRCVGQIIVG